MKALFLAGGMGTRLQRKEITNMKKTKVYANIAFLSTYPSRECGIATFTEDLVSELDRSSPLNINVIAIDDDESCQYGDIVMAQIRQHEREDYIQLAKQLNESDIQLLVIEHEYGIFGGDHGDYLLDLIDRLDIPVVTTLHTILPEPSARQKFIIEELGKKSERIFTMASNTQQILQDIYAIDADKIEFIHHGVPKRTLQSREALKKKAGFAGRQIISTFGLIGPGKGIEHGIEAIARVIGHDSDEDQVRDNSDVLYLILGATHPALKEKGTAYRNKLVSLVEKLNLGDNVKFINKFLSKDEIIEYLQMSDIYMTPYLAKDQAVSGTLAYAVGYGKAIVSTPYLYAQEMLSGGNGLLAEFANPDSLADCIKQVLQEPLKKTRMEKETAKIGKTMYWDQIALQYTKSILGIIAAVPEVSVI